MNDFIPKTYDYEDAPEQIKNCMNRFKRVLDLFDVPCWIVGGAIRSYLSGGSKSDIDVCFRTIEDFEKAKEKIMNNKEIDAKVIYDGTNVLKLSTRIGLVDLVKKIFHSPVACIAQFDFTVICVAINKDPFYFVCHEMFFIDLASRRLVINALPFPLSTLQRLQKYIQKGFTICNGGLFDIARAIQRLNLDDPNQNHFSFYPDGTPRFPRID